MESDDPMLSGDLPDLPAAPIAMAPDIRPSPTSVPLPRSSGGAKVRYCKRTSHEKRYGWDSFDNIKTLGPDWANTSSHSQIEVYSFHFDALFN